MFWGGNNNWPIQLTGLAHNAYPYTYGVLIRLIRIIYFIWIIIGLLLS